MIIANGKIYESSEQDNILNRIESEINETLSSKTLETETVVSAIDKLSKKLAAGEFDEIIDSLPIDGAERYKELAIKMLSRENIEFKLRTELGAGFLRDYITDPPHGLARLRVTAMPLGVVLHIAAGNVDGLPAFSLAEGLLTGNINILKLPQADNGLSVSIINELIAIEPKLADFIYVFDTPSTDIAAVKKMADMCNGIVVWGGEAAVSAVRRFAPVGAKLIEWGHKLSFAYVSGYSDKPRELKALASHIITTKQLLCSSCQVIYIDTVSMSDIYDFCGEFLPYLESAAMSNRPNTIDSAAEVTLRNYAERLESFLNDKKASQKDAFRSALCALTPREDSELELSDMFGNVLVKRLPQSKIITTLRRKKGYLQTAGLICADEQRRHLTDTLSKAGVVRITSAGNMSSTFSGESHDGEYPLRRYLRIVNAEIL